MSDKLQGVFVGYAIANERDEFLAGYRRRPGYFEDFAWSLVPYLAKWFDNREAAERAIARMQRSGLCVVEIFETDTQLWVGWLKEGDERQ